MLFSYTILLKSEFPSLWNATFLCSLGLLVSKESVLCLCKLNLTNLVCESDVCAFCVFACNILYYNRVCTLCKLWTIVLECESIRKLFCCLQCELCSCRESCLWSSRLDVILLCMYFLIESKSDSLEILSLECK